MVPLVAASADNIFKVATMSDEILASSEVTQLSKKSAGGCNRFAPSELSLYMLLGTRMIQLVYRIFIEWILNTPLQ